MGKCYVLTVDGTVKNILNSDNAVAADYIGFISGVIATLQKDKEALEKEANQSGRTILGHHFEGVGSRSIPEVTDE